MIVSPRLRLALLSLALPVLGAFLPGPADAQVAWRGWDEGLREARQSGRPVLVDVYTDWCGFCRRMDREVYSRADVREYLESRFVPIKLDAESDAAAQYEGRSWTYRSLAARFRVTGYPTTVFLKPTGQHVINVPGYIPPERFRLVLRYVGEGHLERGVDWDTFSRRQPAAGR